MTHLHITTWVVAFILLIIATMFYKQQKTKPAKILHMILRVVLLLILLTGAHLFMIYDNYPVALIIKAIVGIWALVAIEMVVVGISKGRAVSSWLLQLVIVSLVAIYLGFFRLPLGIFIN